MKKRLLTMSAALMAGIMAFASSPFSGMQRIDKMPMAPTAKKSVFAIGKAATRADEQSMNFSYAGELGGALSFQNVTAGSYAYMAMVMKPTDVKKYVGNKITNVIVYSGAGDSQTTPNANTEAEVFITNNPGGPAVYTQAVTLTATPYGANNVKLTTPYEIKEGETLMVGYKVKIANPSQYYLVLDGVPTDYEDASLCALSQTGAFPAANQWQSPATEYGAFCITLTIAGDKLPKNMLDLTGATTNACTKVGSAPTVTLELANGASNAVTDFDLMVEATGEETYTENIQLQGGIPVGKSGYLPLQLRPFTKEGAKEITLTVTKVNGVDNGSDSKMVKCSTIALTEGYPRMSVVEEATGNGCKWCPSGIVMMDYLKEKYGDKVARIAVHNYQGDVLSCAAYNKWVQSYVPGYPFIVLNRESAAYPTNGKTGFDDILDNEGYNLTYANLEFGDAELDYTADDYNKPAKFNIKAEFVADLDDKFNVSVAIVQNNMGPFKQANGYAGGGEGPMDGWENKGISVSVYYDDVARNLSSFPGKQLTADGVKKGTKYAVDVNISSMKVTKVAEKFTAVAMLTKADTGEVIQVAQKEFDNPVYSGVNNIMDGEAANGPAVIYNLNGVKMQGSDVNALPSGMYIIRQGGKSVKVVK